MNYMENKFPRQYVPIHLSSHKVTKMIVCEAPTSGSHLLDQILSWINWMKVAYCDDHPNAVFKVRELRMLPDVLNFCT